MIRAIMSLFAPEERRGFTLIELLTVIAIMSVLATTIFSQITAARGRARDARRVSDLNTIKLAMELAYAQNGVYLSHDNDGNIFGWEASSQGTFMAYLQPWLAPIPVDPINVGAQGTINMFAARPLDGMFFYMYYKYPPGMTYGCSWPGAFGILGFRAYESVNPSQLPKVRCGPQPCAGGGGGGCRDWSTEFDYSVVLID